MPAYTLPPDGTDVFRIFVVPLPVNATRYVRGLEFRTGSPNVVHHANIRVDRTSASRAFDDADPAPGYDGLIARSAGYPDGHFLAWTPGQVAPLLPKGLAWTLSPGTDLVVELHMQPTGKPELVQPTIGLFFGSDPPERTPAMLRLGRQNIDIAPGDKRYMVTDTFVLPVDVDVLALQPHAHYRAREIRGTATRPDGSVETLIEIKDWDFRWQQVYRYVDPVHLPKGTRLAMEYRYDNSADNPRNVQQPPQRVRWGQRSNDEMGDFWLQVLTRDDRDLDTLAAAFRPKQLAEDIVGYEARIAIEPSSVELHDDIAMLYLETGRTGDAVRNFAESARLRPSSAATHFNLATALTMAGRRAEAADEYQKALALRPAYALAHNNLGVLLLQQGQADAALAHFAEAVRADPDYAEALDNLGRVRLQRGEWRQGVDALERAVQLRPDWPAALTDLALGLSTASDAAVMNPARGVVMAERAATVTRRADPLVLDVLASAYAAAGDRARAMATLDEALRLTNDARMVATLRAHLESLGEAGGRSAAAKCGSAVRGAACECGCVVRECVASARMQSHLRTARRTPHVAPTHCTSHPRTSHLRTCRYGTSSASGRSASMSLRAMSEVRLSVTTTIRPHTWCRTYFPDRPTMAGLPPTTWRGMPTSTSRV